MKKLIIAIAVVVAGGDICAQVTHPQSATTQPPRDRSATATPDTMRSKRTNRNPSHPRKNPRANTRTADTARYRNTNDNSRYNGNNR